LTPSLVVVFADEISVSSLSDFKLFSVWLVLEMVLSSPCDDDIDEVFVSLVNDFFNRGVGLGKLDCLLTFDWGWLRDSRMKVRWKRKISNIRKKIFQLLNEIKRKKFMPGKMIIQIKLQTFFY
jgi:hypothetical protein